MGMTEARINLLHDQAVEIDGKDAAAVELAGRFSSIKLPKTGPREPGEVTLPSKPTARDALTYSDARMRALMDDPTATMDAKRAAMRNYVKIQNLANQVEEDSAQFNANVREMKRAETLDALNARRAAAAEERRKVQVQREQDAKWLTRAEFEAKYPEA
jgi:hypothetical protein